LKVQGGAERPLFMWEIINQRVQVEVLFGLNQAQPQRFTWQGREITVKKVNLVYSSFVGRAKVYYFAVSDDTNYFKLQLETDKLAWTLVEVYSD